MRNLEISILKFHQLTGVCNSQSNVYIALYDFNGESGELSFQEGDRIVVSGDVNGEWILGRLEGGQCEGRLPKTFVQKLSVF